MLKRERSERFYFLVIYTYIHTRQFNSLQLDIFLEFCGGKGKLSFDVLTLEDKNTGKLQDCRFWTLDANIQRSHE